MNKISTKTKKRSSGSFLPFKNKRTFLFIFGYTPEWWGKYLKGFTHVSLMEIIEDSIAIVFEPTLSGCYTLFRTIPTTDELKDYEVIEIEVIRTKKNRLIRPLFQTCTTFVQYLAGISLGAITCEGLYKLLVAKTDVWLFKQGIVRVHQWEQRL